MARPYHATAADRIADITAQMVAERHGVGIAERLDPLARALWFKRDRWAAEKHLDGIGYDDDRPGYHGADQVRRESAHAHRAIIERLWASRACDRQQRRMMRAFDTVIAPVENAVNSMKEAANA